MSLAGGDRLGPYEILARIGAGGMGEVYKARDDTRLDRIIAVKTAKIQFSERFEREARAIASLNHPNICTLHDVGPNYLVMEYIEGAPIKAALPLDRVGRLAIQIADALDAAHSKGIVHRDLKPANVLITRGDRVKILDFGLALMGSLTAQTADETLTMGITDPGTAVGTVAYMSPEQARGQALDARTDLWSFGSCSTSWRLARGHSTAPPPRLPSSRSSTTRPRRFMSATPKSRRNWSVSPAGFGKGSRDSLPVRRRPEESGAR